MDTNDLQLRDKVAIEILKAMLINKMPHTHTDMIEWDCKIAYKYADSMIKLSEQNSKHQE